MVTELIATPAQHRSHPARPLIDALPSARVLVIGDAMLDRYIYGTVDRISPEAPIPVVRVLRETAIAGGAANVVANLAALGVQAIFLTVLGDDAPGREIAALLRSSPHVDVRAVVEAGRPTTVKTRYVAGTHQLLRADNEAVTPIGEATIGALLADLEAAIEMCDIIVCSDYGKGVLTPAVVRSIVAAASRSGRRVVVDPKGTDYAKYAEVDLITPNRAELRDAVRMPVGDDGEIAVAASAMLDRYNIRTALVTRSEDGMSLIQEDRAVIHIPAETREVFDVSGAGDTVVAVLSAALALGAGLADAARFANVAAGIVVGKAGTAVVSPGELRRVLLDDAQHALTDKILTLAEASARVAEWRDAGLAIGFTNGCFDLLHPGHISLLTQARKACDRLIVGLNTDASIRRLKGAERPVQQEIARATVLSSLANVDAVVLFDDDTPLGLIASLRPDVLVKGADYTIDQVVGAELVQSFGGRVVLADLVPDQSTTKLLHRSQRRATL